MEEIKGEMANSIKSYLLEVHIQLLQCMRMLLAEYQKQMNEYCNGYYSLDTKSNAQIQQERLEEQIESLNTGVDTFHEIANSVSTAIGLASGLANISVPTGTRITSSYEQLNRKATTLRQEVGEYEQSHLHSDFGTMEEMMSSIAEIIQRQSGKIHVTITSYQAGSLNEIPAYTCISQKLVDVKIY